MKKVKPFSTQRMALINPARPAVPSVWPTFVLIDPTYSGDLLVLEPQNVLVIAVSSRGSPTADLIQ